MSATASRHVVVVGGSVAGIGAAGTLRAEGYDGAITMVGDEPHPAYARPSLSKGVLCGRETPESVELPPLGDDVEVRRGVSAVGLDLGPGSTGRLHIRSAAGEESLCFDGLVIATGARARSLARPGQTGEFVVRSLDDCLALSAAVTAAGSGSSVAVLGGGYLGMEIAASLRGLGHEVTVVSDAPPLCRQVGPHLAQVLVDAARDAGVRIVVHPGGAALDGEPIVRGLRLADGTRHEAATVVVAVGDVPNVEWLAESGLATSGVVSVDTGGRALLADPDGVPVVAAGDVTARRGHDGRPVRTPHWNSAISQGRLAARTLLNHEPGSLGAPPGRPEVPYFWTEGSGVDVRITGEIPVAVQPLVIEGSLAMRSAVLQWLVNGVPVAAATVNHRMPLPALKRLARPTPAPPTQEVTR